ncbi:MAG: hypothetical protein RMK57_14470 [Bryobacterales bacterium]|nr:hypothetical protein [Bryobacteraceae bacterium]MDW8355725.1 hypothetical protein [Bryobacterales bacterium]
MRLLYFVRRLHLYLGMSLLPWFLMYGLSSFVFNHPRPFDYLYGRIHGPDQWTLRLERPYHLAVTPDGDGRAYGAKILSDLGLEGAFGVYWAGPREFHVYRFDFWNATQVKYFLDEKRLVVLDKKFRWDHFLTGMHARGGFEQAGFGNDAWAVLVDLVAGAMLLWVATGLYMWWHARGARLWGALALGAGLCSFVTLLMLL